MQRAIWIFSLTAVSLAMGFGASAPAMAQTIATHRIPASLAMEAASEVVSSCAAQGYNETAVVVDADGVVIAVLRGDKTGAHTLDSAHDKAYTAASFKRDTLALSQNAAITALAKLPHVMFFGGGVAVKIGDEVVGAIGASGAPGGNLDDGCAHAGLQKIQDRLH